MSFFPCLHPQGWPMNRQVFTSTRFSFTAVLYDSPSALKYVNLCARRELLAGRTGPLGSGVPPRASDKDRWTPKSTSCDCSSCLRTSLISAQRQLTVFPSYSNEPEKPKKRRGGRLYVRVFFDGIGIERLKLKGFNVWLRLNKPCCLAVPAFHTRNCVIKCLRTKKSCRFYTRDHRSNLKTCAFTYSLH